MHWYEWLALTAMFLGLMDRLGDILRTLRSVEGLMDRRLSDMSTDLLRVRAATEETARRLQRSGTGTR